MIRTVDRFLSWVSNPIPTIVATTIIGTVIERVTIPYSKESYLISGKPLGHIADIAVDSLTIAIGAVMAQLVTPYFFAEFEGRLAVGLAAAFFVRTLIDRRVRYNCFMKSELLVWCNEVVSTPEHANRLIAAQRIGDCYSLLRDHLNLSLLGLTSLPASIGQLPNLRYLKLYGNPLNKLPEAIRIYRNSSDNKATAKTVVQGFIRHQRFLDTAAKVLRRSKSKFGSRLPSALIEHNVLGFLSPTKTVKTTKVEVVD
jgi:hypothetical protein